MKGRLPFLFKRRAVPKTVGRFCSCSRARNVRV
uniref:Uncharacterized protein n=1 Tax=Anguilla anguilla TaxID=7936 RepID=A0A0E9W0C2_ANGAN